MIKIVALDGYTLNPGDLSWNEIGTHGALEVFNRSTLVQGQDRAETAQVIIVNKFIVDKNFLQSCKKLQLVCISATGTNNVDLQACREKNIAVCNVANYSTAGVAQHTFAMLLDWMNHINSHNKLVKKGYWSICPDFSFTANPIHELTGKTFGILGYGDIGKHVAQIALAFGMKVMVCRKSDTPITDPNINMVDFQTLVSQSDVISLHSSLNKQTTGIINKESLALMKPSTILINTSRGGLINEDDLAECLSEQKIACALLDVLCEEPSPLHHPFYNLENCKITPHIAWASVQSRTRLMDSISQNIAAFFEGNPKNIVN